ncbi:MAG: cytochrome d ubiquinol oxidase subunit II [Bacteroidales bacterium]|jgi:cytochrome d oxidase, subunit II (cydB)|nr:cytochrome d ubiquinol oxidase subunit II [Bacteroidales bacterium]
MTYTFLQDYWWILIALLGGLLVALMFVQGANIHLMSRRLDDVQKRMILNSTGRKWELTFTTLVTFGGAFFASFPLFYSTSFGGAYWVWVLLLVTFVFQAVSYEFYAKKENLLGTRAFRIALLANGILAPFLVGTAVGTFFTGSHFTVDKAAIANPASPVISTWTNAWHGLEALGQGHAVLLGLTVVFLAVVLGALYILNNVNDHDVRKQMRLTLKIAAIPFLLFFVTWFLILMLKDGFSIDDDGIVSMEPYKYLQNFLHQRVVFSLFIIGVLLVLAGMYLGIFTKHRRGFWFAFPGAVLVVVAVFFIAGFNGTAYYPSLDDLQSSLTIRNSSSSYFTLKVMFWVSLLIPFVVAYIAYAWRAMDHRKITREEIEKTRHKY